MTRPWGFGCFLAVLWLGLRSAYAAVSPEAYGLRIVGIHFDCPVAIDQDNFLHELPLRPDAELTTAAVEDSLEWLNGKRIFESVNLDTSIHDQTVDLRFRLQPIQVIVGIDIQGVHAVNEIELQRRGRIREDEPVSEDKITAAVERLRALYSEHGYPDAKIDLVIVPGRPGQARVRIIVKEGQPTRIGSIEIHNLSAEDEAQARRTLPFTEHAVYASGKLEEGRAALVRWARQRSYYEVSATATDSLSDTTAALRYEVRLGPRFEVEVRGNARIASDRLLDLGELWKRPIVTAGTWRLLALRMRELYRQEGYHFAEVQVSTEPQIPKRVVFDVREGEIVRIESVRFRGNLTFPARKLREAMQSRPPSRAWLGRGSGIYREDVFNADLERIRQRYREAGYRAAEVRDIGADFLDERRRVRLTLEISEGPQSVVQDLQIHGAEALLGSVTESLKLQPEAPYRPELLDEDRRLLASRLASRGYADARVQVDIEERKETPTRSAILVRYRIEPETQVRIRRILIRQNYFTRDSVIRRELPFETGDPFDPAALVAAQTKIYRRGLFRSVAIHPVQDSGPLRDIVIEVGERPGGEILYGFGYNTRAGLRTFFQVAHRNILGTGRQVSLRGDLNLTPTNLVPDEYIVNLGGKEPHFLDSNYDLRSNIIFQRSERAIDEFSIRRFAFSTGFEREFVPGLQASLLLEYEDSDVYDVKPDAVLTGQDVGPLRIVSLNPIVVYDGRDDAFAPTRGVFETLRFRYGSPAMGSDVHFVKVTAQHSQYVPLPSSVTWIYAARAGFAEPLRSSTTIPLRERFFLGGRTSVRGFEENSIGPRGVDGNPVGGDVLFNVNTELRFPLVWGLGGAVFVDGGGLYLRERGISVDDFRESAGPGLRYQTPIGAISLDYGFKLNRRRGESIGELHFTIGNIF